MALARIGSTERVPSLDEKGSLKAAQGGTPRVGPRRLVTLVLGEVGVSALAFLIDTMPTISSTCWVKKGICFVSGPVTLLVGFSVFPPLAVDLGSAFSTEVQIANSIPTELLRDPSHSNLST